MINAIWFLGSPLLIWEQIMANNNEEYYSLKAAMPGWLIEILIRVRKFVPFGFQVVLTSMYNSPNTDFEEDKENLHSCYIMGGVSPLYAIYTLCG